MRRILDKRDTFEGSKMYLNRATIRAREYYHYYPLQYLCTDIYHTFY